MQVADDPGCLEDGTPSLLRFDAGMRRTPVDRDAKVEDPLPGRDDVAVGARAFEDQGDVGVRRDLADVRRGRRRADLLVRVADEHEALERKASPLVDQRLQGVEAGEQTRLHVGHAGAVGDAVVDAERPLGGGPGSNTVSM